MISKKIVPHLSNIFLVQLFLFAFVPPLQWGTRHVFLSDLWNWLWFFPVFLSALKVIKPSEHKKAAVFILAWTAIVIFSWAGGLFRGEVLSALKTDHKFVAEADGAFLPAKEAIMAFRFLIWILSAWSVFHLLKTSPKAAQVYKSSLRFLLLITTIYVGFCFLEKASYGFKIAYYGFFDLNPNYDTWRDRVYGLFRSPLEAATWLAASYFLLLGLLKKLEHKILLFIFITAAMLLTKTASLGLPFLVLSSWLFIKENSKIFWMLLALLFFGSILGGVFFPVHIKEDIRIKTVDFLFRIQPWKIYLSALFSKPYSATFGMGFPPFHVDSSYLWLWTRFGTLGLIFLFLNLIQFFFRIHQKLPAPLSAFFILIAISGLTLDLFIYRGLVNLMLCVTIPALAFHYQKTLVYRKNENSIQ